MQEEPFEIEIYDKRQELSTTMYVDRVADNIFRAVENEVFNCRLTLGTEFETCINKDGKHEVVRIVKESNFSTKRFFLTSQFSESDYRLLGDEVVRHGGFWQVDFGGIATVNLPRDSALDLEGIFKTFNFNPTYITNDF
jgi:hypothetical protein